MSPPGSAEPAAGDPSGPERTAGVWRARRGFLALLPLLPTALLAADPAGELPSPAVRRGMPLVFPRDHGAHPAYRTEWWYMTGIVRDGSRQFGFQVTFFRSRRFGQDDNPSAFAPKQLLMAHAAISDEQSRRLVHDQAISRTGFGLAAAAEETTDLRLGDWRLVLAGDTYRVDIPGRGLGLRLAARAPAPPLLQGEEGVSRKGPREEQASFYYSRPQLAVQGSVETPTDRRVVAGQAWLDHEWSTEVLDPAAQGWDWVGINLDDGGALMAFRIRREDGSSLWAGGTLDRGGRMQRFAPGEVVFTALRTWSSLRSGARYPVAMRVAAGPITVDLVPLFDDQEVDARLSTATVYWEGAVTALTQGRRIGAGYLELTGYWKRLRLS